MYTAHCRLYTLHCTVLSEHSSVYRINVVQFIFSSLYTVHSIQCTLYTKPCTVHKLDRRYCLTYEFLSVGWSWSNLVYSLEYSEMCNVNIAVWNINTEAWQVHTTPPPPHPSFWLCSLGTTPSFRALFVCNYKCKKKSAPLIICYLLFLFSVNICCES